MFDNDTHLIELLLSDFKFQKDETRTPSTESQKPYTTQTEISGSFQRSSNVAYSIYCVLQ